MSTLHLCLDVTADRVSDKRDKPPMRVRCPADDGSPSHLAFNVEMPVLISKAFAQLAKVKCHCGKGMVIRTDGSEASR